MARQSAIKVGRYYVKVEPCNSLRAFRLMSDGVQWPESRLGVDLKQMVAGFVDVTRSLLVISIQGV